MAITSKKNFRKRNLRKGNRRSRVGKRRNVRSKQSGGADAAAVETFVEPNKFEQDLKDIKKRIIDAYMGDTDTKIKKQDKAQKEKIREEHSQQIANMGKAEVTDSNLLTQLNTYLKERKSEIETHFQEKIKTAAADPSLENKYGDAQKLSELRKDYNLATIQLFESVLPKKITSLVKQKNQESLKNNLIKSEETCCNILDKIREYRLKIAQQNEKYNFFYSVLNYFKSKISQDNDGIATGGKIKRHPLCNEKPIAKTYEQYYKYIQRHNTKIENVTFDQGGNLPNEKFEKFINLVSSIWLVATHAQQDYLRHLKDPIKWGYFTKLLIRGPQSVPGQRTVEQCLPNSFYVKEGKHNYCCLCFFNIKDNKLEIKLVLQKDVRIDKTKADGRDKIIHITHNSSIEIKGDKIELDNVSITKPKENEQARNTVIPKKNIVLEKSDIDENTPQEAVGGDEKMSPKQLKEKEKKEKEKVEKEKGFKKLKNCMQCFSEFYKQSDEVKTVEYSFTMKNYLDDAIQNNLIKETLNIFDEKIMYHSYYNLLTESVKNNLRKFKFPDGKSVEASADEGLDTDIDNFLNLVFGEFYKNCDYINYLNSDKISKIDSTSGSDVPFFNFRFANHIWITLSKSFEESIEKFSLDSEDFFGEAAPQRDAPPGPPSPEGENDCIKIEVPNILTSYKIACQDFEPINPVKQENIKELLKDYYYSKIISYFLTKLDVAYKMDTMVFADGQEVAEGMHGSSADGHAGEPEGAEGEEGAPPADGPGGDEGGQGAPPAGVRAEGDEGGQGARPAGVRAEGDEGVEGGPPADGPGGDEGGQGAPPRRLRPPPPPPTVGVGTLAGAAAELARGRQPVSQEEGDEGAGRSSWTGPAADVEGAVNI